MNIYKPLIGILSTPYIGKSKNTSFITMKLLNVVRKAGFKPYIIPYNLNKIEYNKILKNIDGIIFPGSQLGNFYHTKEFIQHYKSQKYLVKKIKEINKYFKFPILGICHGYQNLVLIENNVFPSKKNVEKYFLNVNAYSAYKTIPKFIDNKYKKLYNKSRKIIHNNKLGFSRKVINKSKKFNIMALSNDKNNLEFVEIIKHKKYPFIGFQAHPERNNQELLKPFFDLVKKSNIYKVKNKCHNKSHKKIYIMHANGNKKLCSSYNMAKKNSTKKCCIY